MDGASVGIQHSPRTVIVPGGLTTARGGTGTTLTTGQTDGWTDRALQPAQRSRFISASKGPCCRAPVGPSQVLSSVGCGQSSQYWAMERG